MKLLFLSVQPFFGSSSKGMTSLWGVEFFVEALVDREQRCNIRIVAVFHIELEDGSLSPGSHFFDFDLGQNLHSWQTMTIYTYTLRTSKQNMLKLLS